MIGSSAVDFSREGAFSIPAYVCAIGRSAFQNCTRLTSITMPSGVTSIGTYAFFGCNGLTSITIPFGVTSIEMSTFQFCTGLTSISIPASVAWIEAFAFSGCVGLTSITMDAGVTSIGAFAFQDCTSLTSISIPAGVISIGRRAFSGCSNLTHILINTDSLEEFERIKKLLPEDVREKAIINSVLLKAKQIWQQQLLVDFSVTTHPIAKWSFSPYPLLCDEIVKEIFSYDDFTMEPVLSLKEALEQEPGPDGENALLAYKTALESIEREHVFCAQCDALVSSLQRYNDIIKKGLPSQSSGFFAGRQTPSNPNNAAILVVYNLVEHLIGSLKDYRVPILSPAEQGTLSSRPHLLAKIPQYMREEMGFDVQKRELLQP